MANCLALELLHIQPSSESYYRCQVGVLESVTVRRSEHVRHEEDIKRRRAPFLPDCSLISAGYPFLTFTKDLLSYHDETARVVSRYYFGLSKRTASRLTSVSSCRT
jgi:hypothetical protein